MNIDELTKLAMELSDNYDKLNSKRGVKWDVTDFMSGFVGDVGDLSKSIMAHQGLRHIDDCDAKLAHELADCLWSVLILAQKLNVNLESEFVKMVSVQNAAVDKKISR